MRGGLESAVMQPLNVYHYLGLLHVVQTWERLAEMPEASAGAKAIMIRKEVPAMNAAFRLAGIKDPFVGSLSLNGETLVECFEKGGANLSLSMERRSFG